MVCRGEGRESRRGTGVWGGGAVDMGGSELVAADLGGCCALYYVGVGGGGFSWAVLKIYVLVAVFVYSHSPPTTHTKMLKI